MPKNLNEVQESIRFCASVPITTLTASNRKQNHIRLANQSKFTKKIRLLNSYIIGLKFSFLRIFYSYLSCNTTLKKQKT